jgi:hypothetical protein
MSRLSGTRRTVVILAAGFAAASLVPAPAGASAPTLPADPNAHGYIGFCDEDGHNVTGGSTDSMPFVWKAVASEPPPAAYQGQGQNAVLNIYQPRPGVGPADWSGDSLTAASFYTTKATPTVQLTYADIPIRVIIHEFPPLVDGMYQLRVFYGKANYGLYSAIYPATTIRVQGDRWSVVSGGTVDCGAAKAVSSEQLTGVVKKKDTTPHAPSALNTTIEAVAHPGPITLSGVPTAPPSSSGHSSGHPNPTSKPHSSGSTGATRGAGRSHDASPVADSAPNSTSASSSAWLWWTGAAVLLAALLFLASFRLRRDHRPDSNP